jgi:UDP-N-acetylmuramoylalanine-D-glutamate ligase
MAAATPGARSASPGGAAGQPTWEVFADLPSAFAAAAREARPGETVLFSPGYASYDQFRNFAERGDLFCALVTKLAETKESRATA